MFLVKRSIQGASSVITDDAFIGKVRISLAHIRQENIGSWHGSGFVGLFGDSQILSNVWRSR